MLQFLEFSFTLCNSVYLKFSPSELWVWGFPNYSCQKNYLQIICLQLIIWQDFFSFVLWKTTYSHFLLTVFSHWSKFYFTLDSGIDVGQEINIGTGKFGKNNKRRALNKRRTLKIWQKFEVFVMKKLEAEMFSDYWK